MLKHKPTNCQNLYQALLAMRTSEEMSRFCRDLLSKHEIDELSRRWQVACMLAKKIPYTEIERETGLSSATIAKISHWRKRGLGGYKLANKRLNSRS